MDKEKWILIIVAILLLDGIVSWVMVHNNRNNMTNTRATASSTAIVGVSHPTDIPPAISQYFDLSSDTIVDKQVRTIADGSTQSVVSFKTNDFQGAYTMALNVLTQNGFTVQENDAASTTFAISGEKSGEMLQVIGFAGGGASSTASATSSITIIHLLRKQ